MYGIDFPLITTPPPKIKHTLGPKPPSKPITTQSYQPYIDTMKDAREGVKTNFQELATPVTEPPIGGVTYVGIQNSYPFVPIAPPDVETFLSGGTLREGATNKNSKAFTGKGTGNIDSTMSFGYNFPSVTMYSSDSKINADKSISITYNSTDSNPNYILIQKSNNFNYSASKISVYPVLHNIVGVSVSDTQNTPISGIIGELFIESSDKSGYVCFFLQSGGGEGMNDIDKIIRLSNATIPSSADKCGSSATKNKVLSTTINLNSAITQQSWGIQYMDGNKQIVVLTNPIQVNKNTASVIQNMGTSVNPVPFVTSSSNWTQIQNIYILGKDEIYIDCQPTGVSDDQVAMRSIPIDNGSNSGLDSAQASQVFTNFLTFIIIGLIGFFVIPVFFKYLVVDSINLMNVKDKPKLFLQAMAALTMIFCLITIILFAQGEMNSIVAGMVFGIFGLFFTIVIVQNIFLNKDFLQTKGESFAIQIEDFISMKFLNVSEFFQFFIGIIIGLFYDGKNNQYRYIHIVFLLIFFIISSIMYGLYPKAFTLSTYSLTNLFVLFLISISTLWQVRRDTGEE